MVMKRLMVLPLVLLFPACPGGGGPGPQPTPTPTPWECELEMPGCHEVDPPQQCSSEESPCWHNPTDNPQHCEEAPKCADPPPNLPQPQCPQFMDRGGAIRPTAESCNCYFGQAWHPCPPIGDCCFPPHEPGHFWTAYPPNEVPTQFYNDYRQALAVVGDRCGKPPEETLELVAKALQDRGVCASGPEADSVSIKRPDGKYEEWHAVFYGNGCTVSGSGAYKAAWEYTGTECRAPNPPMTEPTPPPPTPPPGEDECPEPHPDMNRMKFTHAEHNGILDTTLITVGQPAYCESIGICCMPGTGPCGDPSCIPRGGCPVRPECGPDDPPDYICHDRAACEMFLCDQKWECNGEPAEGWRGNPAQSNCRGHWKTWCAKAPNVVAEGDR